MRGPGVGSVPNTRPDLARPLTNGPAIDCAQTTREDIMVQLTVNGQQRSFDGDPSMPLMWFLRDELGLIGTKFGCGVALCGACTVHLDGEAVRACGVAVSGGGGQGGVTIQGVGPEGGQPGAGAGRTAR